MNESDFILPLKFYNTSDKEGTTYIGSFVLNANTFSFAR